MNIISDEVKIYTFHFLEGRDLASSSLVSKEWNGLCSDDSLWKSQAKYFIHDKRIAQFCKDAKAKGISLKTHLRDTLNARIRTVLDNESLTIPFSHNFLYQLPMPFVFEKRIIKNITSDELTLREKCICLKIYLDSPRISGCNRLEKRPLLIQCIDSLGNKRDLQLTQALLDLGTDPNVRVSEDNDRDLPTPIFSACYKTPCDIALKGIQLLIEYGANPNTKNKEGKLPIDFIRTQPTQDSYKESVHELFAQEPEQK